MFIKNAWYVAAWSDDLTTKPVARRICNVPLVLYRNATGEAAALLDRCCHRAAPLSLGRVTDVGLECGYHGLVFDTRGACVFVPGQPRIPPSAKVQSYRVVEKDSLVWIWMGDAETADTTMIVDYPYHNDHARWPFKHETMPIQANYKLMVDNLMDLTHLGFVHVTTIGGNPTVHVEAKMDVERTANGLKFIRWILDADVPPTIAAAVHFEGKADRWQEFEYIAPGVIKHFAGAIDANTGAHDQGKREGGFAVRIFHGITPETETSCFYFWSIANGFRQNDPSTTEEAHRSAKVAFSEDKVVIEQQQRCLTELGESGLVDIRSDAARISMRRTIDALLSKEATSQTPQAGLSGRSRDVPAVATESNGIGQRQA